MKQATILAVMIASLVLGMGAYPAMGYPVTFEFAGEIDHVFDPNDFLGAAVAVGSPFSGLYTFESTTPDSQGDDPAFGTYEDAITVIPGQVGELPFLGPVGSPSVISLMNDAFGPDDEYAVDSQVRLLDAPAILRLVLLDEVATIFSDDSLPLSPPDLGSLDVARFNIYSESDTFPFSVGGNLTLLTPEPGTLVLMGFAALAIVRRRGPVATGKPNWNRRTQHGAIP